MELGEMGQITCNGKTANRLKHTIIFKNYSFGLKHRLVIRYKVDSDTARFCGDSKQPCDLSVSELEVEYPLPHQYWKSDDKRIVNFTCWMPETAAPDLNLDINVTFHPESADLSDKTVRELSDSFEWVIYACAKI